MRQVMIAAAALLTVGATVPPPAAAMTSGVSSVTLVGQAVPDQAAIVVQAKKKKKKDKKDKSESATLNSIPSITRGTTGVRVIAEVSASDRFCELTITWKDGTAGPIVRAAADGASVCTFSIDVPNESRVVGKGVADLKVLKIKESKETKVATASRTFTVK